MGSWDILESEIGLVSTPDDDRVKGSVIRRYYQQILSVNIIFVIKIRWMNVFIGFRSIHDAFYINYKVLSDRFYEKVDQNFTWLK